ncbi:MAG: SMP-30/gluconolactonase/LRE family protein [Pseudomonadota bacterium]
MIASAVTCLWHAGAELGEGPLWHGPSRSVYFVDIRGRRVHRCAVDGTQRRSWDAPGAPGFIVPADAGGFVCGLEDGLYRFCERAEEFTLLRSVEAEVGGNRLNDGYVDRQGSLWFGSMDNGETAASGSLYRIDRGGALCTVDSGYIITNGPAMSPGGDTLYHTDTLAKTVYAFDVKPDGSVGARRHFATIDGAGHPDGMAVDAEGCVWIALFGGARIERYSAAGALIGSVPFPVSNVTKLAFGGDDLRTVFVTTAWKGLTRQQRAHEPLAGALFTFKSAVPGLAQNDFSIRDFA